MIEGLEKRLQEAERDKHQAAELHSTNMTKVREGGEPCKAQPLRKRPVVLIYRVLVEP